MPAPFSFRESMKGKLRDAILQILSDSGLSERELASTLGVSQSYINKIKNGKIDLKTLEMFFRLVEMYGGFLDSSLIPALSGGDAHCTQRVLVFTESCDGFGVQLVKIDNLFSR